MTSHGNSHTQDQADTSRADTAAVEETATSGTPEDAARSSESELQAARAEAEQWRDRFLRKAAEFENYRKRSDRERAESAALAKGSVLVEFLPIMDACERALQSFPEQGNGESSLQIYRDGVELLFKQLSDTLSRLGVVRLEAKGQPFDPHLHEALTHMETAEYEDNTVIEELRSGYLFKERLLRPAQVVVAKRLQFQDEDPVQS